MNRANLLNTRTTEYLELIGNGSGSNCQTGRYGEGWKRCRRESGSEQGTPKSFCRRAGPRVTCGTQSIDLEWYQRRLL